MEDADEAAQLSQMSHTHPLPVQEFDSPENSTPHFDASTKDTQKTINENSAQSSIKTDSTKHSLKDVMRNPDQISKSSPELPAGENTLIQTQVNHAQLHNSQYEDLPLQSLDQKISKEKREQMKNIATSLPSKESPATESSPPRKKMKVSKPSSTRKSSLDRLLESAPKEPLSKRKSVKPSTLDLSLSLGMGSATKKTTTASKNNKEKKKKEEKKKGKNKKKKINKDLVA